jgi:hypothetical protein
MLIHINRAQPDNGSIGREELCIADEGSYMYEPTQFSPSHNPSAKEIIRLDRERWS